MRMSPPPSQLFVARIWKEVRTEEDSAVRVQIRHVLSGETRYFIRWCDVVRFVMQLMEDEESDTAASDWISPSGSDSESSLAE